MKKKNGRKTAYILMTLLVTMWGFDYVVAKMGLEIFKPMSLLFCKYTVGFTIILTIKLLQKNFNIIRVKDIPLFLLCSLCGEVLYFACEYNAMSYIPASLITIILAFVPVVSIIAERIIFKKRANKKIIIGMILCLFGVVLVIGADISDLLQGKAIGYILAFGAVFCWNSYNYITSYLTGYDTLTLVCTQMICSLCIMSPVALAGMPDLTQLQPMLIIGVIYLGMGSAGVGFLITVYGLKKLGPTTSALFSDFMPVSTAIFGWIFLNESLSPLQIIGGVIVIAAGFAVIKEKGRLDEKTAQLRQVKSVQSDKNSHCNQGDSCAEIINDKSNPPAMLGRME